MKTITLSQGFYHWEINATSFEHGLTLAKEKYEKLGLIGRAYIYSSCGKTTWIN